MDQVITKQSDEFVRAKRSIVIHKEPDYVYGRRKKKQTHRPGIDGTKDRRIEACHLAFMNLDFIQKKL